MHKQKYSYNIFLGEYIVYEKDFNFNNDNIVSDSDFEKTEYNYVVPEPKKPKTKKYGIKTIILCGVISALVAAIISATVSSALIARSVNQNNVNNTPQINSTQPNSNPQSTTLGVTFWATASMADSTVPLISIVVLCGLELGCVELI